MKEKRKKKICETKKKKERKTSLDSLNFHCFCNHPLKVKKTLNLVYSTLKKFAMSLPLLLGFYRKS
jgi:hypothetical protein